MNERHDLGRDMDNDAMGDKRSEPAGNEQGRLKFKVGQVVGLTEPAYKPVEYVQVIGPDNGYWRIRIGERIALVKEEDLRPLTSQERGERKKGKSQ